MKWTDTENQREQCGDENQGIQGSGLSKLGINLTFVI